MGSACFASSSRSTGARAATTPATIAPTRPQGLPTAITSSPTRNAAESPISAAVKFLPVTCSAARSREGSTAVSVAANSSSEPMGWTISVAPRAASTTCALVMIVASVSPEALGALVFQTMPEPMPRLPA